MAKKQLNLHHKRLLILGIFSLALWLIPETRPLLQPLIYLNTHIHELCHALSAWATGGRPDRIEVFSSGSGLTPVTGGSLIVVASAGYVGAAIIGGLLLFASSKGIYSKRALVALGAALLFSLVALVRADTVGIVSAVLWIALLFGIAKKGKPVLQQNTVTFLGIQQCLTSTYSLFILQKLTVAQDLQNDAGIMQEISHIPALFWAITWSLMGLSAMWIGLRSSSRAK